MQTENLPTHQVVVLLAGTVDPVNASQQRARSYGSTSYWQEYPDFINQLQTLINASPNTALFDAHGWSGDNTAANRKIAGSYLADRLCGANGETAYYSGYKKHRVLFHLIGHSHGGNVANELMARAAELAEWPAGWEFASVCYLSTPFYRDLHLLSEVKLAKNCQFLNVINEYDLTQRFLAAFSLHDLIGMIQKFEQRHAAQHGINTTLQQFQQIDWSLLSNSMRNTSVWRWLLRPNSISLDAQWLTQLQSWLRECSGLVSSILSELPSEENRSASGSETGLSEELRTEIIQLLTALHQDINLCLACIGDMQIQHDYRLISLLHELSPVLQRIIRFFDTELYPDNKNIWQLVHHFYLQQIEVVELPLNNPAHQLNVENRSRLKNLNLSSRDLYHGQQGGEFESFVSTLQDITAQLAATEALSSLQQLVLSLLTVEPDVVATLQQLQGWQQTVMSWQRHRLLGLCLNWGLRHHPVTSTAMELLPAVTCLLDHYLAKFHPWRLYRSRNIQELNHSFGLKGFLLTSHSVSRQQLWPEVQEWLQQQFTSPDLL
jgi:hypothetical protein